MELFISDSGDERRLHPRARELINNWIATIAQNIPQLVELDIDQIAKDVATYLNDDEKITCTHYLANILGYLSQCTDIQDNTLYPTLISLNKAMGKLLPLLLMVYRRKADKTEADRRKTEAEQREREEQAKKKAEAERKKRQDEEREREALREARQKRLEEQQKKLEVERKAKQEKEEAARKERAKKAERERKEKEEEERWHAAYRALIPSSLVLDAQIFLNESEYSEFNKSIGEAIDVYLEQGKEYLDDHRPFLYGWYLNLINNRKDEQFRKANRIREEERRETAAESEARAYNQRLNSEIAGLKRSLCPSKKDHGSYFRKQVNDPRYLGYSFDHVLTDEHKQTFGKSIMSIGKRALDKLVSNDFRQFIGEEYWRTYFLLPSADYSFEGVTCLDFTFDLFAVVEIRVWLKPGQRRFLGYAFDLPWREERGQSTPLQEWEFLGYHYLIASPEDLGGYIFWQSIPLVLLRGLLNGETNPDGVTISAASDGWINYKVPKFKDEVDIPDNFAGYLRSISSIDEMASIGIMTEKVASIAKGELGEFTVEDKASEYKVKRKDSKKAKALKLFSEGKRPGDPEVKSLGIKPNTAYRYYQDWKASLS